MTPLPRSTPQSESVDPTRLEAFFAEVEAFGGVHSAMVVRHGSVIGERWWAPGERTTPHIMWSVTKSFVSTAVGLAIADGLFTLDSTVIELLPDAVPATVSENLAALRVRDLLTMSSGHAEDTIPPEDIRNDVDWASYILGLPFDFEPGTHFVYNSGASYLLSAIVQRATGEHVQEYLRPRLFDPLGIATDPWEESPQGIDLGGWGLYLTTEDLATFGQLLLQHGAWNGVQLVPAEWIAEASSAQVSNDGRDEGPDWSAGYGFQYWRGRHNSFRADGRDGQFCIVLADQDAVVVLTSEVADTPGELALVWDHLLPALT